MTEKTVFEQYYEIRSSQEELAIQEKNLKEKVLEELKKLPESVLNKSTYESPFGKFTKRISKSISYSTDFKELEMEIGKELKELTKPLEEKIKEIQKPFIEKVEQLKVQDIESGKAQEITSIGFAYQFVKQ